MINIVTVLFNEFETLDVFGPIEIFGRIKQHFNPGFYSLNGGIIKSSQNAEVKTKSLKNFSLDNYVLFIPGGIGTRTLINNEKFVSLIHDLAKKAEYIFCVCTGSVLFAKTGLLNNKRATTNKRAFNWAVKTVPEVDWIKQARWVKHENTYTSSGVSAGIDMALSFVSDLFGYDVAKKQSDEIEYIWNQDSTFDPFSRIYD